MDIYKQQLDKLNGEIDAISLKIDEEKAELKTASPDDKTFYKDSINVLNSRLEGRSVDRSRLLAPPPNSAPAPGKPAVPAPALCA